MYNFAGARDPYSYAISKDDDYEFGGEEDEEEEEEDYDGDDYGGAPYG
jgi:hypothetical protein